MTRSPVVSPARSTTTSYDVPPAGRAVRRARARRLHAALWWRHGCGIAGWSSLLAVVGLWFWGGGARELTQPGTGLNSVGRLSGLAASDLLLLQVFLMARIPLLERAFGQGEPARRHRLAALSVILLLVHVLAITLGYAAMTAVGVWGTLVEFVVSYPGILGGVAGTVALVAVAGTSRDAARSRLRYQPRHLLHLSPTSGCCWCCHTSSGPAGTS